MVGKELCKVYYYAGGDVEQMMKWPVLRTKKLTISPWDCASCDMHNLSHDDVGERRLEKMLDASKESQPA